MSLYGLGIVEHSGHQVPVLDVHIFEPIPLLLTVQLIEQGLLQVYTFDVQDLNQTLVVTLVSKKMEHGATGIAHVQLLMDHIRGCAQVCHQIQHNVFESKVALRCLKCLRKLTMRDQEGSFRVHLSR